MTLRPSYAKLHILLATGAPLGLVIRHGTAKSVCTLLWDRRRDEFTLGQWMRGRIDLNTCDLAPDGEHFIYAAQKYVLPEIHRWAAVARTPYLKAVAYYPACWGGGWFVNSQEYCLVGHRSDPGDRESPEVRRVKADPPTPSLPVARLLGSGWAMDDQRQSFGGKLQYVRPAGAGWELRQYPPGRYGDTSGYELTSGELTVETGGWEWADVDGKRLVWVAKGCLWAGVMRKDGLCGTRLLHDFNGMKFEAIAAPYEGGRPVKLQPPPATPPRVRPLTPKRGRTPLRKKPDRSRVRPDEDGG